MLRQRRLWLAAFLLLAWATGAAGEGAISSGLMTRLQDLVKESKEKAATSLAQNGVAVTDGASITVDEDIQYHYQEHPEKNYGLSAGMTGTVLRVDSNGDADVRWGNFGRKWLLQRDFHSVKVVETTALVPGNVQGTLGTWFDRGSLGTNYNSGIYFQVQVLKNIEVTSMVGNFKAAGDVRVFTRPGELGDQPGGSWKLVVDEKGQPAGQQVVKSHLPFALSRGNHSFLMASSGQVKYSNADFPGQVSARDDQLVIYAGYSSGDLKPTAGAGYRWFRHWDGIFQYTYHGMVRITTSADPDHTTTATALSLTTEARVRQEGTTATTTPWVTTTTVTFTTTDPASMPAIIVKNVAPVYDFWSSDISSDSFHMLPAWPHEALLHVQFYALSQPAQFAEPVHTFWHEENREYTFHLGEAWHGEKDVGNVAFYAFRDALEGTEPVFDFWSDRRKHTFHMGEPWYEERMGSVQFYAFPDGFDYDLEANIEAAAKDAASRIKSAQNREQGSSGESHSHSHPTTTGDGSCPKGAEGATQGRNPDAPTPPPTGNEPQPVYDFFHQGRREHRIGMGEPGHCEVRRGDALFWAYPKSAQGLAPVYAQGKAEDCTVGIGDSCDPGAAPLFYAFAQQVPGTVPVYNTWDVRESDKTLFFTMQATKQEDVKKYARMAMHFVQTTASRLYDDDLARDQASRVPAAGPGPAIAAALVVAGLASLALALFVRGRKGQARTGRAVTPENRSLMPSDLIEGIQQ